MNNFYVQLEVQGEGVIPFVFTDLNEALAKHYAVLSVAAKSELSYHASFIIRDDGVMIEGRVFDRRENTNAE